MITMTKKSPLSLPLVILFGTVGSGIQAVNMALTMANEDTLVNLGHEEVLKSLPGKYLGSVYAPQGGLYASRFEGWAFYSEEDSSVIRCEFEGAVWHLFGQPLKTETAFECRPNDPILPSSSNM